MTDLMAFWTLKIEKDLSPFLDPGTQLNVDVNGFNIKCAWQQRRRSLEASFRISPTGGEITVDFLGQKQSYKSFFASTEMADLLGLAKMILQARKPSIYIETNATLEGESTASEPQPATTVVEKILDTPDDIGTSLIMVTGEAGAGKTSALKQMVRLVAERFTRGQSSRLLLYIDAQGRALARFSEALATELQDLRVNLTYHAVSTLVRLGLVVPVIDGFDELIGVGGYDDAFSSISLFIEELDGLGSIVASARSTYYEHEFLSRANRVSTLGSQVWRLQSISISAWSEKERDQYVFKRCQELGIKDGESDAIGLSVRKIFSGQNAALSKKPLFVARTVDALLAGADLTGEGALLDQLVLAFLIREQREKLLAKNGTPLISVTALTDLYAELSEEMWNQGTRELDKASVRELAEQALIDSKLPSQDQQVIVERMPSLAFLQTGERKGSISFEHEVFFSYFLAKKIAGRISSNSAGLSVLLGRSVLPEALAESVANIFSTGKSSLVEAIERLCSAAASRSLRQAQAQENAALLVASLLTEAAGENAYTKLNIHDLAFPGASLRELRFERCEFNDVEFRRTELCGTVFSDCKASKCTFSSVLVDGSTVFDINGANEVDNFIGLQVLGDDSRITQIFDPIVVRDELKKKRLPSALQSVAEVRRNVAPDIVDLITKFSRAFLKRNPVCVDDDFLQAIFGSPHWQQLQTFFIRSGVVKEETRATGGPRRVFLRRQVNHEEIPIGLRKDATVSNEVKSFWDSVEATFPLRPINKAKKSI